jgi:hypothetical protein
MIQKGVQNAYKKKSPALEKARLVNHYTFVLN